MAPRRPTPANVLTTDGTICGVIDFGDLCAGDPAYDLAAVWLLLPDDTTDHFYAAYQPTPDTATMRHARGWAMARALSGILIGDNGVHGRPGGKPTRGPPAHAALNAFDITFDGRISAAAARPPTSSIHQGGFTPFE